MIKKRQYLKIISIVPVLIWALLLISNGCSVAAGNAVETEFTTGADAVNLKIRKHYTVAVDGSYKLHLYVKRRILTYKGKKAHADFKFTYNQAHESVKLIKGQTITAGGEILGVKTEEIHDIPAPWNSEVSIYSKSRQMVVSLPAVEPGSEVEVELEVSAKVGFWCEEHFRLYDPIIDKEVIIDCPTAWALQFRNPENLDIKFEKDIIDDQQSRYHWRGENISALTPERWAPGVAEQGFCLFVSSFNNWAQVADYFNSFFEKSSPQKNDQIYWPQLQGSPSAENPLRDQLFRQMRDLTTYAISFLETDFKVQNPAKTRRLGYGKSCDLALLFASQLRLQGEKAHILLVNRQQHFLEKFADLPYPGWWDTALVESGGDFFLFATDKPAPGITGFDNHWALDLKTGKLVQIKDRERAEIKTELTFNADNDSPDSQGNLKLTIKGSAATSWRAQWRDLSPPEREITLSQLLHQINPQASPLSPLTTQGLQDDRQELIFSCNFKVENLFADLSNQSEQMLLPIKAPDFPLPLQTLLKSRQQPLTINNNLVISDRIVLKLPANFKIKELPVAASGNFALLNWQVKIIFDKQTQKLTYERKLELQRGIFETEMPAYEKFVTAIRNLYRPEALRVIFTTSAAP